MTEIKKGITNWDLDPTVLLDIDAAFKYTNVDSICVGESEDAVPGTVVNVGMFALFQSNRGSLEPLIIS